jgi:hypothetical protein
VSFYDALSAGKAVPSAFNLAVNSLKLSNDPDASLPRLFEGPVRCFDVSGTTTRSTLTVNLRALDVGSNDESPLRLRYRSEPLQGYVAIHYSLGYIELF